MTIIVNFFIKLVAKIIACALIILPPSPFKLLDLNGIREYMPTLNWFVPITECLAIFEVWCAAISVFYIYQIVLRWIKAIS